MSLMSEKIDFLKNRLQEIENKKNISKIENLFFQLKELIVKADNERVSSGMSEICAQCGKETKSCCGSAIEFKYSDELILINLILGIRCPEGPQVPDMCYFLTDTGCCLIARDVFCINFICDKIKEKVSSEKLKKLRELESLQLDLQFRLEQTLKKI